MNTVIMDRQFSPRLSVADSEHDDPQQRPRLSPASSVETLHLHENAAQPSNEDNAHSPPLPPAPLVTVDARRELTWWDVSALIINKMIGTGIFTGPPTVLMYTGRKDTALLIWAAGFAYTLISMTLYLEFSRKLPYTGGEIIYLDELLPKPTLLSYTCYALYFICIYSTATNGMQFARQTMIAATGSEAQDQRVMRFIAVVITSVTCLLLYFSTATGRRVNRWLAFIKILLMLIVFGAGADMARKIPVRDNTPVVTSSQSPAAAILQVLYAFQGWENGTLVAGEIQNHKILRQGFIRAVWIVGVLYMIINIVYCFAIPWNPNGSLEEQYVPLFFGNSDRAKQVWAIFTAFSAVGSMVSVTYTCTRVKQTIAWANILPWSPFWRQSAPVARKEPRTVFELNRLRNEEVQFHHVLQTGEPQGGLILHWLVCVIYICGTAAISTMSEAISFPGQLLSYAHAVVGVLGFFFPKFNSIPSKIPAVRRWDPPKDESWWLQSRIARIAFGWTYAVGSIALLVLAVLGPYKTTDGKEREVKGWLYPAISFVFLFFSLCYYFFFVASARTSWVRLAGVKIERRRHGRDDRDNLMRRCDACDGTLEPHRHARDGYENYYEVLEPARYGQGSVLYWLFGGTDERYYPRAFGQLEGMKEGVGRFQKRLRDKLSTLPFARKADEE